jgi:hypothetical protein
VTSARLKFELQFDGLLLLGLIGQYDDDDEDAANAGRAIARGQCTRSNLEVIFRWKTRGRGVSRLTRNSDQEIEEALRLAGRARTERAAVSVLCGLHGVEVPVASAVLTWIDPGRYTVIDYRVLGALGYHGSDRSVGFYLRYLEYCRCLAKQHHISLRDLDRALWAWSKSQSENRAR